MTERISLEKFIEIEKANNSETPIECISKICHENEDTSVEIEVLRIKGDKYKNTEVLKFLFDTPVYYPIEKIYFNDSRQLMVLAPPFLYVHDSIKNTGIFTISDSYTVTCDKCNRSINYILTTINNFYCADCFEELTDEELKNAVLVFAGELK